MKKTDRDWLEERLARALSSRADTPAPSFEAVFDAAARRFEARRRARLFAGAGLAAATALVAILLAPSPEPDTRYVEMEDFLATTRWQAPSDVLLPRRRIDLYEDLPVMIESTRPAEGALL